MRNILYRMLTMLVWALLLPAQLVAGVLWGLFALPAAVLHDMLADSPEE